MPAISFDLEKIESRPPSMAAMFVERVKASGPKDAFGFPENGTFRYVSWDQADQRIRNIAAGLVHLGIGREDRVGLVASTRVEWVYADLAIMLAGGATTTVYPSTNAEDTGYILGDSGSQVVFAEDDTQIAKLTEQRSALGDVVKVVTFDGTPDGDWVISLGDLEELGKARREQQPDEIDQIVASIKPEELATLVYTSGTTGKPKGVRLRHDSWSYEGAVIQAQRILSEDDLQFLWLPMSHVFGKVLLSTQLAIGFPTAIDGTVEKIVDNLAIVKPTFMGAAPRIFEKAYARIITMQAAEGGLKEKIFKRAFAVGLHRDELVRAGKSVPLLLGLQHKLFDKLVFAKVRERFGGRVRFFISGSAALNQDIAEWFNAAGITILEGYGLTETSAGAFVNHPEQNKFGTVGPAFPGSEVKLGDNDEVLIRGPHVMEGYHNLPAETSQSLDPDGWFHTGDKGALDADGHLKITGRIKELFKTSGGKYIVPPAIESKFKALCPYASQFMVFGSERNYVIALVTLDPDAIANWAQENEISGDYTEIVRSSACREMVQGYVNELNETLNRWETIKKFEILDHDLSIESGELTPSMKVKRNVVETKYAGTIDALYDS